MKIQLDYEIKIEIKEAGETKDTLSIFYREYTKAEKKTLEKDVKKFKKLYRDLEKTERKLQTATKRVKLLEDIGNSKEALVNLEKKEELEEHLDNILEELEKYGEQDKFYDTQAKEKFNLLVSGKDKAKLAEIAERKGYITIISLLDREKDKLEKKQFGE